MNVKLNSFIRAHSQTTDNNLATLKSNKSTVRISAKLLKQLYLKFLHS